jgi:hypothetical protein
MASESRALLDEQIADLKALGTAANLAFHASAGIIALLRQGRIDQAADVLACLMLRDFQELEVLLDKAECWLAPQGSITLPGVFGEVKSPSACGGAFDLCFNLRVLIALVLGVGWSELPQDVAMLANTLRENTEEWVPIFPTEGGERCIALGETAAKEASAAIQQRTKEFLSAQPPEPNAEAPGTTGGGADDAKQTDAGAPTKEYPTPHNYALDKWIYENIDRFECAELSVELKAKGKPHHWVLITSRNGFKNAARKYAEFAEEPHKGFPDKRGSK